MAVGKHKHVTQEPHPNRKQYKTKGEGHWITVFSKKHGGFVHIWIEGPEGGKAQQAPRKKKIKRTRREVARGYKAKRGPIAEKSSERANLAKATYKPCNKAEKDYAKANEHKFANHIGGKSFPDNDPSDVDVDTATGTHHLEIKSMLSGEKGQTNMARESIGRKVAKSKQTGRPFHMVVLDDRDAFNGGESAHLHSGHRMYFKTGVARYNIKDMHPVKDEAEIKAILDTPYDQWPEKAKASKNAVAGVNAKWIKS